MTLRLPALATASMIAVAAIAVPSSSDAVRDWPRMGVSTDGKTWVSNPSVKLVSTKLKLVPGDEITRTFYIRNQMDEPAQLRIGVDVEDPADWFASRRVRLAVQSNGQWEEIEEVGASRAALMKVKAGAVVPVKVRIRFQPVSGSRWMHKKFLFDLHLRLTEITRGR